MSLIFGAFIVFILHCQIVDGFKTVQTAQLNDFATILQGNSLIFGLARVSQTTHTVRSNACAEQLSTFQAAVLNRAPWAMKMLDAAGGAQSGFIHGNHYWLGSRATCAAVQQGAPNALSPHLPHRSQVALPHDVATFHTDYRIVYLQHNSTWALDTHMAFYAPLIHVGLCVPSVCNNAEILHLMSLYLQQDLYVAGHIYDLRPLQPIYVKDLQLRLPQIYGRASFQIFSALLLCSFALTFAAFWRKRKCKDSDNSNKEGILWANTYIDALIDCYDVERNWLQLFTHHKTASKQTNPFYAINGVRFLCAFLVVVYHTFSTMYFGIHNKMDFFRIVSALGNVNIFIDVFFVISGFFHIHQSLGNASILSSIRANNFMKNSKLLALMLFHRLLRLLPLYIVTICLSDIGSKVYEDMSVFHIKYRIFEKCAQYWWRNLLFIQNLFDVNDVCVFWTWSLSCDMQFFLIATIILIIYVKNRTFAKLLVAILLVLSIFYTIIVGVQHNFDTTLESTFAHLRPLYMHPLPRLFPYALGAVAGCIYVQQRSRLEAHKRLHEALSNVAIVALLFIIFVPVPVQQHSVPQSIALLLVQRVAFALCTCCLLLACGCGRLNWLRRIFEWDVLQRFGQCTYAIYLFNPGVIIAIYAAREVSLHMSTLNLFFDLIGIMVLLLAISVPFTLLFESPYKHMSRLLLQRARRSKET